MSTSFSAAPFPSVLVTNSDEEATTGPLEIPAGRSVLFVYSHAAGPDWVPLTTLDSRSSRLEVPNE